MRAAAATDFKAPDWSCKAVTVQGAVDLFPPLSSNLQMARMRL